MKKNHRTEDESPELPLLWEQIPDAPTVTKGRSGLSPDVLEKLSVLADAPANEAEMQRCTAGNAEAEPASGELLVMEDLPQPAERMTPVLKEDPTPETAPEKTDFPEPEKITVPEKEPVLQTVEDGSRHPEPEPELVCEEDVPSPEELSDEAEEDEFEELVSAQAEEELNEVTDSDRTDDGAQPLVQAESFAEDGEERLPEEEQPAEIFDIGPLSVGERLRSVRCSKELTLQQVAMQLCTSQTNIEELENGHKRADHYGKLLVERLCGVYDIPSEDLLQDFIRECPSGESEDEEDSGAPGGSPHRHDYIFSDGTLKDARPRREKMSIPAFFLTVVIVGVLLILLGAWGRQKFQHWQDEQNGRHFRLDILRLLPQEKIPVRTLPVPRG